MIGSWRWNAVFGGFGAVLTFMFSMGNNPLTTTLVRCLYAFIAFALIAFAVRFVLAALQGRPSPDDQSAVGEEPGSVLDMVTPDEEESLNLIMKENWSDGKASAGSGFQPLQPQKLVSLDNPDTEEVVQAIRRMNDER